MKNEDVKKLLDFLEATYGDPNWDDLFYSVSLQLSREDFDQLVELIHSQMELKQSVLTRMRILRELRER